MNLINRMIASESNQKLNIDGTVKGCDCKECTTSKVKDTSIKYPPLTEEEIEQIIKERYNYKDKKTKKFIIKALRKHGDKYDYSNVIYVKCDKKIDIICRVEGHNSFPQTPNKHLKGRGCQMCGGTKKLTTENFIKKANKIHGVGTYDYSIVDYVDYQTEIIIICPKHGPFPQTPLHHLQGSGCRLCANEKLANERRKPLEKFIEESNEVHGEGTYDYSKVDYVDYDTYVTIICPIHGDFPQTPNNHLSGSGCPKCNKNKGEEAVRKFLTERNIKFEEQKTFEGCKNVYPLRFDFYLPKYNLCIESDGNPHFKKINWSNKMTDDEMEKELKLNQKRDNIKNEYCKKNGINLVRVNNLKAVKELSEYFQTHGIIKEQTIFDLVS